MKHNRRSKKQKLDTAFLENMLENVPDKVKSHVLEICLKMPSELFGPWRKNWIDILVHRGSAMTYFETIQEGFSAVGGHNRQLGVSTLVDYRFDEMMSANRKSRDLDEKILDWLESKYPNLLFLDVSKEFSSSLSLANMCRGKILEWLQAVRKDNSLKVWLVLPKTCPEILRSFPSKLQIIHDLTIDE